MKSFILPLFLMAQGDVVQGVLKYDYEDNGDNWSPDNKACGNGKRQSPIDLPTDMDGKEEKSFQKHYENVASAANTDAVKTTHYGQTKFKSEEAAQAFYLTLDITDLKGQPTVEPVSPTWMASPNYFVSSIAKDYSEVDTFYAKQLHFHTGTEHTIDGKRFDLEMHIVHQAVDNKDDLRTIVNDDLTVQAVKYPLGQLAVVGIMFDQKEYSPNVPDKTVEAIDKFFDSLMWHQVKAKDAYYGVDEIALGELMAFIDTQNRWVYSGSLTTPPCYENLYWNVVKTVYPIKPYHFAYYKKMLDAFSADKSFAPENGNYRKERKASTEHNLKLLKSAPVSEAVTDDEVDSAQSTSLAMIILFCISMFLVLGLTVYVCILHDQVKQSEGAGSSKRLEDDKVDHGVMAVPQESIEAPVVKENV